MNKEEWDMNKVIMTMLGLAVILTMTGCTPEVGSEKWCKMMEEKPSGDWTANDAADYAKHCIFK
jgi:hypothetical protein